MGSFSRILNTSLVNLSQRKKISHEIIFCIALIEYSYGVVYSRNQQDKTVSYFYKITLHF